MPRLPLPSHVPPVVVGAGVAALFRGYVLEAEMMRVGTTCVHVGKADPKGWRGRGVRHTPVPFVETCLRAHGWE